jgi:hypothetical protein
LTLALLFANLPSGGIVNKRPHISLVVREVPKDVADQLHLIAASLAQKREPWLREIFAGLTLRPWLARFILNGPSPRTTYGSAEEQQSTINLSLIPTPEEVQRRKEILMSELNEKFDEQYRLDGLEFLAHNAEKLRRAAHQLKG